MKAGRELDALVAEKVMGEICGPLCTDAPFVPNYSTNISAAWEVFQTMDCPSIYLTGKSKNPRHYKVRCNLPNGDRYVDICEHTAPLAICVAALKAVGVEVPK